MKIIIFGATGMVGKQLVKQALHNGHQVKAFGRNVFTAKFAENEHLELVQGALFDEGQVKKAISGCDAVLSALGGDSSGVDVTRSLGIKNIAAQMTQTGVSRILVVGGKGILKATDEETGEEMIMDLPDFPQQFLPVSHEHLKAYQTLKSSGLNWTMVGSPDIIDGEATGEFTTATDYAPTPDNNRILAGDLALFMLSQIDQSTFSNARVGISN